MCPNCISVQLNKPVYSRGSGSSGARFQTTAALASRRPACCPGSPAVDPLLPA